MSVQKFKELKDKVNSLAKLQARASGAIEQLLKRAKSEHGASSLKQAKETAAKLEQEITEEEIRIDHLVKDLIIQHTEKLNIQ